jgi:predicted membrane protein
MDDNEKNYPRRTHNRIWPGILIVTIGALLLAREMKADIPDWIFSWPCILIGVGIVIGFQHNFRNISWLILIIIGCFLLVDRQMPELQLHHYLYPGLIICLGLFFIFRRRNDHWVRQRQEWKNSWRNSSQNLGRGVDISSNDGEYLDSTSIFGGVKKVILSKNFKGGDITCLMGGAEIDLSQADIQASVTLDITQVFGGTKLVIPGNWNVKTDITSIFAGIEDKRAIQPTITDPNKILVLDGTSVFGGIEITSYPTKM